MATAGLRYIVSLVERNEPEHLIKHRVSKEAFKPEELSVYQYVDEHFRKHGELPSLELLKKNAGPILPSAPDAPTHYADEVRKRFLADKLSSTTVDIRDAIVEEKDPYKALQIMAGAVPGLVLQANPNMVVDFRQAKALLMQAYKDKLYEGDKVGISLGWETLDSMTNGLVGGDMLSVVGRPGLGKTFMMLYAAMHTWAQQSKNVLFVSMEMNHLAVFQRMASMYSHLNLNHLKGASLSTKGFNKMKASLTEVEGMPASFHVAHGNMSANVDDIWSLAQYLDPEFIVIDGAYLLKHPNPRFNRFERVAENMRLMKSALCTDMDIPLAASWQFNREAAKKAKKASQSKKDTNKDKGDLEDIGFSDEIGQISSLALGLFEDESVETMVRRRVEIMKGRNGETGEFYLNWDFYGMNFNEYFEPDVETLQFV